MKRNVATEKAEQGHQQQLHDMVVRLIAVAELLVCRAEDKYAHDVLGNENADQDAGHAVPKKTQIAQGDV